jgi:serine/threonine-protein kinase
MSDVTDPVTHGARLRELFERIVDLPASERADALDAAAATPGERERLGVLLAADSTSNALLDTPAAEWARRLDAEDEDEIAAMVGRSIGPWRLRELIGQGGSSVVFRATRDLDGTSQTVALKLLRTGLFSPEAQRRFRRERAILVQLSHPNLVRLIDGGVSEAGIPYIVMELVDGAPLTTHATNRDLDRDARLRLLAELGRTVDAAHRALIVHRDLKPSNILVDASNRLKVLDFGIARLLDQEGEPATATQHRALTPGYAAPEQYEDGPLTTAVDVYALGVLAGELLIGCRLGPDATMPATADAAMRGAWRRLDPDLATILRAALAGSPERRYPSARHFAEDIERHLRHEPVSAHPPSPWYRARKFVARHRGGVAMSGLFLVAIVAALGIALWQAGVARTQAQLAERNAQRAGAVRDLLVDLFDAEIPSRPRDEMPGTAELLEQGARHALNDLAATPAVQSDVLRALGRVYDHLALPDKGEPLLDAAIASARRVDPPDPVLLGAALGERGELELSRDRYAAALAYLDEAIALQRVADPGSLALAVSLDRRALAESKSDAHELALRDYREALAIREHRLPANDPEILGSLNAIATATIRAGRPGDAIPLLRHAVEGARAAFGENHVKTAHYVKNYAVAQGMLRNFAEAASLTEEAVRIERTLYPPGSPDIVNGLNNLGAVDLILGRLHAARDVLEEGRSILRAAGQERSMAQTFVLGNLARVEELLGNRTGALALLREAEDIAIDLVGARHARSVSLAVQRGRAELLEDAATAARLASRMQEVLKNPEALGQFRARSEVEARFALGLADQALGRDADAQRALRAAVALVPTDHVDPLLLPVIVGLAQWQRRHGEAAESVALLKDTLERAARELPATHYALGELHLALAEADEVRDPRGSREHANAARDAFAELPEAHPWQRRLAALRARGADPAGSGSKPRG